MWRRKKRTRRAPKASGKAEKCVTKWCRNKRAAKITRYKSPSGKVIEYHGFLTVCWKCHSRQLKARHPATYALNAMRGRARQRGLPFTITLAEFREFCKQTGYLEKKGQEPHSMTIDRIDHDKGYHIWNIRLLTHAENSENGHVVPGKETKQNDSGPDVYDYDYGGPEPDYDPAVTDNEPF